MAGQKSRSNDCKCLCAKSGRCGRSGGNGKFGFRISDFGFRISDLKVHPNPFSKKTVIEFRSSGVQESNSQFHNSSTPQLTIYDVSGTLVRTLVKELQGSRVQRVEWKGMDEKGNAVKSGVYFCVFSYSDRQNRISKITEKIIFLK